MHKSLFCIFLIFTGVFSSCSAQLSSKVDKSAEEIEATYQVIKDVSYSSDKEQNMDIYISKEAKSLKGKNFTVVFLHGGGYYISDKSKEEKYIQPYLKKGMNVVNINYRLKRGISIATEDLTYALNFLKGKKAAYPLNLDKLILTGFSAGGQITSLVGFSANNADYPNKLAKGLKIAGVINFSGPLDGLDVVEKVFMDHKVQIMKDIGNALFPNTEAYAPKDSISKYEPINYFDKNDPPLFLWHGGKDDQIPAPTYVKMVELLNKNKNKNTVIFIPEGLHSPSEKELMSAYKQIFLFLDKL